MHTTIYQMQNGRLFDPLWLVILICSIFGILYGLYISPSWSEAVEFAQVWSGLIVYPKDNPWGQIILGDSSLQISLPALLLHYGADKWTLSFAQNAFAAALAFVAAGTLGFILTQRVSMAIIGALILLTYDFANPFGYWMSYPSHMWQFGQTGQYLCMIALVFMASRYYKTGSIIGNSLVVIHLVWWPAFLLAIFSVLFFMDRRHVKPVAIYTIITSLLWVLLHKTCLWFLPPIEGFPKNPTILGMHADEDYSRPIRGTFTIHNILLGDSSTPWLAAIGMYLPVVLFAIFAGIYVWIVRHETTHSQGGHKPDTSSIALLAMAILPLCCAIFYQCVAELDPYFNLFAKVDPRIPGLLFRAIINRWLNLAGFMLPLLPFALLSVLTINHSSFLAIAALTYFFYFTKQPWDISIPYNVSALGNFPLLMPTYGFFFIFVGLLAMFHRWEPKLNLPTVTKLYPTLLRVVCLIMMMQYFNFGWNQALEKKKNFGAGEFDQILSIANHEKGSIIYGVNMRFGEENLLRFMVHRPSIVANYLNVKTPYAEIYCYTNPKERIFQWVPRIQACFEERTKNEWRILAERTHATALIAPETWNLTLTPTLRSNGLSYYRLT